MQENPIAAAALELLLDASASADVPSALVLESATYSTLQAGPEHHAWLATRVRHERPADHDVVLVARDGDTLRLTLNRPHVRNAFNAAMREALLDGLEIATLDPSVERVVIDGAGDSFCSGGDLDEFGTSPDVAAGHVIRLARSAASVLNSIRDRVHAELHGACIGAGIELPSFASTVVAHRDTFFQLPELGMGLVPGAGGTVSVTRRIGRWRTAYLALSGIKLDVDTALQWGLVDGRAEERPPPTASRP